MLTPNPVAGDALVSPKTCTCWIGRGNEGGWRPDRKACAVHGDASGWPAQKAVGDALVSGAGELAKEYVDWGSGEALAMAALDNYPVPDDGLPKSTSVVFRIHQLGHVLESAQQERDALVKSERTIRERLWLNHGCPISTLYGDDGELQCNNSSCRIDFKREPLPKLLSRLIAIGRLHAGIVKESATEQALAALRQENEGLYAFNVEYANHLPDCDLRGRHRLGNRQCTCGFETATRSLSDVRAALTRSQP